MPDYKVPFYSQYNHISILEWQNQGCGIVALKMIFEYWRKQNPNNKTGEIETLIKNGVEKNAFITKVGWSHAGLISIARGYGYDGLNKDLALLEYNPDDAFGQLEKDLKYFPLIVSVWNKFEPQNQGGHLVVVTKIEGNKVYINDPEEREEKNGLKILPKDKFLSAFKKRYIAVYPANYLTRLQKLEIFNVNLLETYLAMIRNSEGTKMFRNLYLNMPKGKKDVLNNGKLSCSIFVSSILYQWSLIADTHANVSSTMDDLLGCGWLPIAEPKPGAVIEWESKVMNDGSKHKHLGFYLEKELAISNRPESGTPETHHWTYGTKNGRPVRKIEQILWHPKLNKK